AVALDQLRPEFLLELGQLLRDRRLRQPNAPRRLGDRSGNHHRLKNLQLFESDIHAVSRKGRASNHNALYKRTQYKVAGGAHPASARRATVPGYFPGRISAVSWPRTSADKR